MLKYSRKVGTLNCKNNWFPEFYKHKLLIVDFKTLVAFIKSCLGWNLEFNVVRFLYSNMKNIVGPLIHMYICIALIRLPRSYDLI